VYTQDNYNNLTSKHSNCAKLQHEKVIESDITSVRDRNNNDLD